MLEGKRVAVVVPAHDEEALLRRRSPGSRSSSTASTSSTTPRRTRPPTGARGRRGGPAGRADLHDRNRGVGAAIVTGYKRAIEERIDVTCVMAADNQMDPADLEAIASPVARGDVEYAKANRLFTGQAWELIPHHRYLGNAVLSLLTKIASGYWHVADSQSGYTAVSLGRSSSSTSTGCTRATAFRTTCSST